MNFTVPVLQDRRGTQWQWTTLTLGPHTRSRKGRNVAKIQHSLVGDLKQLVQGLEPAELGWLSLRRGVRLERVRLGLTLKTRGSKRKVTGKFPVVLEPRWVNARTRVMLCYHPTRQEEWFFVEDEDDLESRASKYFGQAWVALSDGQIAGLQTTGKERIKAVSFAARPKSLLDKLPDRKDRLWDDLEPDLFRGKKKPKQQGMKVLRQLGIDQTQRAADLSLELGMPRSPYREQMQLLLSGRHRRPVLVVGPPQVGKTTIINTWIHDLLLADGYEVHRNLDRVNHVWQVSGQRIISGMSYLGDWEQRCIELLEEAVQHRVVMQVDDLYAFGRLGRTRDSDRNLAEFFRGPLSRGELVMVGECTPQQLQRLEEDAPSFAALFSRVFVTETSAGETLRMMLHEARSLERAYNVAYEPDIFRVVIEMTGALLTGASFPGKALDLVRELAKPASSKGKPGARAAIKGTDVVQLMSRKTGLPDQLIRVDQTLDATALREEFEDRIMGQPEAVTAACDLVLRIRAGLTDPRRPYAVYLFAGPTGTGKTELAKCIAEYLYGDISRLVRFDMGEYSDPEAPARLVGDQYQPRGALTDLVQQQPFCVLLLDEVEKAHLTVLNLLLQLFDEGRLTDASGNSADFTHAAVVMTSNLGSRAQVPPGFAEADDSVIYEVSQAVREFFPPELFNRIDRVIPFGPLTSEVASQIAAKELSQLLARRGLSERNIFVQPTERVLERVVTEGFDPLYGARPVKRYLEQRIGSLLAEQISASEPAMMRIMRLYCDQRSAGHFQLHTEALTEVESQVTSLPMEPLLDAPVQELQQRLPGALDFLDELLEGEQLRQLADRMSYHLSQLSVGAPAEHADALYNLDSMREELRRLKGKIGYLHVKKRADRKQILRCLARVSFLQRSLKKVHDIRNHAVMIELLHVGLTRRLHHIRERGASLMEALTAAYLQGRGELEAWALRAAGHAVEQGHHELDLQKLRHRPEQLVLKLMGLNVLDFFAGETGCHIWRSLSRGSDVIRVRVAPAPFDQLPADWIEHHARQTEAFQRSLELGEPRPLPPNPGALLPLVREYHYDPPSRPGHSAPLEIADYGLGYATTQRVRSLSEGLERIWLLRMGLAEESEEPVAGETGVR